MFDMEDFFGMGYEEEPELPNDLVQGGCEPEGEGWGSFLLGGAIGCMMGAGSGKNSQIGSCQPAVFESFSPEEKIFLTQIWRFEEELDKAQEQNDEMDGSLAKWFRRHARSVERSFSETRVILDREVQFEFENLVLPILNKAAFSEDDQCLVDLRTIRKNRRQEHDFEPGRLDALYKLKRSRS